MLKIRLQRVGRKHEPAFRLVLTDSKNSTKSGRFKEILGSYDPRKNTDSIKEDRVRHWLSQGAQPSDTAHNLLITHKIIDSKKRNVLPKKSPPVKEVTEETKVDVSAEKATEVTTPSDGAGPAPMEQEEASSTENQSATEATPSDLSEEVSTDEAEKEVVQ